MSDERKSEPEHGSETESPQAESSSPSSASDAGATPPQQSRYLTITPEDMIIIVITNGSVEAVIVKPRRPDLPQVIMATVESQQEAAEREALEAEAALRKLFHPDGSGRKIIES